MSQLQRVTPHCSSGLNYSSSPKFPRNSGSSLCHVNISGCAIKKHVAATPIEVSAVRFLTVLLLALTVSGQCANRPCRNGGTCYTLSGGGFFCACPASFTEFDCRGSKYRLIFAGSFKIITTETSRYIN